MKITIGLTRSNRTGDIYDYVPSMDGYRVGAPQDEIRVDVEWDLPADAAAVAEAVFAATNAPSMEQLEHTPGAAAVLLALMPVVAAREETRSVSVGDTVQIGDRRLACVDTGWLDVTDGRNVLAYGDEEA